MARQRPSPKEHLPLSAPVFQILLTLCERPMHGYAILTDIQSRTDTAVTLGAGTLYAAIKRMVHAGMVEQRKAPRGEASEDSRRRYYGITSYGRDVARVEAKRVRSLAELAHDRRLIPDLKS